jgi:uncharacterized membrane protein YfcA
MLFSIPAWEWWQWFALLIGGFACGFINTIAGGGSFITIPLLIVLGQPPLVANATNRFALVFQTAAAVLGYWRNGERDTTTFRWLVLPSLLGSLLGAQLTLWLDPESFRQIFGVMLLLAVFPVLFKPKLFDNLSTPHNTKRIPFSLLLGFFGIGVYSGFLQVGVGVWSLVLLLLLGDMQVNRANAVKSQLLFVTTLAASVLFVSQDQVVLIVALVLAAGSAGGAWLATWLVKGRSIPWLRWLLLAGALLAFLRLLRVL